MINSLKDLCDLDLKPLAAVVWGKTLIKPYTTQFIAVVISDSYSALLTGS